MCRHRGVSWSSLGALAVLACGTSSALGQTNTGPATAVQAARNGQRPEATAPNATRSQQPASIQPARAGAVERPEATVQNALRTNPLTAPYAIVATWSNGAVVLTGRRQAESWDESAAGSAAPLDFFDLKGIVEALVGDLHVPEVSYRTSTAPYLHPGRAAELRERFRGMKK